MPCRIPSIPETPDDYPPHHLPPRQVVQCCGNTAVSSLHTVVGGCIQPRRWLPRIPLSARSQGGKTPLVIHLSLDARRQCRRDLARTSTHPQKVHATPFHLNQPFAECVERQCSVMRVMTTHDILARFARDRFLHDYNSLTRRVPSWDHFRITSTSRFHTSISCDLLLSPSGHSLSVPCLRSMLSSLLSW